MEHIGGFLMAIGLIVTVGIPICLITFYIMLRSGLRDEVATILAFTGNWCYRQYNQITNTVEYYIWPDVIKPVYKTQGRPTPELGQRVTLNQYNGTVAHIGYSHAVDGTDTTLIFLVTD